MQAPNDVWRIICADLSRDEYLVFFYVNSQLRRLMLDEYCETGTALELHREGFINFLWRGNSKMIQWLWFGERFTDGGKIDVQVCESERLLKISYDTNKNEENLATVWENYVEY